MQLGMIWLHTYGERYVPDGERPGQIPKGKARCHLGISASPDGHPEDFEYFDTKQILRVGEGEFSQVAPEIWNFSVSGLEVVKSWLNYRKKSGAGRRSSPLDDIRPERWTSIMTQELLELLGVIEHTLAAYPELEMTLDDVVHTECFTDDELPTPNDTERLPPQSNTLPNLFT